MPPRKKPPTARKTRSTTAEPRKKAAVKAPPAASAVAEEKEEHSEEIDLTDDNETPSTTAAAAATATVNEKRSKRYRSSCPQALKDRITRALSQRLYLIGQEPSSDELFVQKDGQEQLQPVPQCRFAVLGSTGNVYNVTIKEKPTCTCPDYIHKRDLCKHIFFVVLKVMGVPLENPLGYQSAYVPSELATLWDLLRSRRAGGSGGNESEAITANASVREQYNRMMGRASNDNSTDETAPDAAEGEDSAAAAGGVKRRSLEDNRDCPICFDEMENLSELTYCRAACGINFHADCINRWCKQQQRSPTCPNCRQPWQNKEPPTAAAAGVKREGYLNLGPLQGLSPQRDTSTYHRYTPEGAKRRRRDG